MSGKNNFNDILLFILLEYFIELSSTTKVRMTPIIPILSL